MHYLSKSITIAISGLILLTGCSESKPKLTEVPQEGKLVYEMHYSNNLKSGGLIGKLLPHKLEGVYNAQGMKLSAYAGFGIVKCDIVGTTEDSFITLDIDGKKTLIPFADFFNYTDSLKAQDVKITYNEETEIVSGWESKSFNASCPSPDGDTVYVQVFYVPIEDKGRSIAGSPIPTIPGMPTAISIKWEKSNVMVMLNEVEETSIPNETFSRPKGYTLSDRHYVDSLLEHVN